MTKLEKLNLIDRDHSRHQAALASLAPPGVNGLTLWRALRRIERDAHAGATAYCNGEPFQGYNFGANETDWETFEASILARVAKVFGGKAPAGCFVNGDARGYALKLDPERGAVIPAGMQTDWGSYGILAAEINE